MRLSVSIKVGHFELKIDALGSHSSEAQAAYQFVQVNKFARFKC